MKSSQKKTLVDSNVFVGFYNKDDALHTRATKLLLTVDEFITTEQVFVEIINVLSRRVSVKEAQEAGQELLTRDITLLQPLQQDFDNAWKLYLSQKKLSFTDCINIVIAKEMKCSIATFDEVYEKVKGVTILR